VFHLDSVLCSGSEFRDFEEWDFIGAPAMKRFWKDGKHHHYFCFSALSTRIYYILGSWIVPVLNKKRNAWLDFVSV
jgi:hypothetical protein